MRSLASPLTWRGLLAIVVGVIAVAWPGITVGAFVILFAVYAFLAAGMEAMRAFQSEAAGSVAGDGLTGLISLGLTGLISLALGLVFALGPDVTVVTVAELYGLFSIVAGISSLVLGANLHSTRPLQVSP
jgi:uncharacterized membrane protein HdeD (DUF308 family)